MMALQTAKNKEPRLKAKLALRVFVRIKPESGDRFAAGPTSESSPSGMEL